MRMSFFYFVLSSLLFFSSSIAQEKDPLEKQEKTPLKVQKKCPFDWQVIGRGGYYYLLNHSMRDTFGSGGQTGRLEIDYLVFQYGAIWWDAGYFQKTGRAIILTSFDARGLGFGSLIVDERVVMRLGTTTLGWKFLYPFTDRFLFYLGAGPRFFALFLTNDSPQVQKNQKRFGLGGALVGGFQIIPSLPNPFFLDVFVDYSQKKFYFPTNSKTSVIFNPEVSGLTIGGGVGVQF